VSTELHLAVLATAKLLNDLLGPNNAMANGYQGFRNHWESLLPSN
jgi:hypothetical protein